MIKVLLGYSKPLSLSKIPTKGLQIHQVRRPTLLHSSSSCRRKSSQRKGCRLVRAQMEGVVDVDHTHSLAEEGA